jgi:hypothetical protein
MSYKSLVNAVTGNNPNTITSINQKIINKKKEIERNIEEHKEIAYKYFEGNLQRRIKQSPKTHINIKKEREKFKEDSIKQFNKKKIKILKNI